MAALRSRLGESAGLWARGVVVEDGRWKAFSGASSPLYNIVLCHGAGVLGSTADELADGRPPAMILVAGEALEEVEELVRRNWTCASEMPFMIRDLGSAPAFGNSATAEGRQLAGEEVSRARGLIADVFRLHDRLASVALPPDAAQRPGQRVWGTVDQQGGLAACVISVEVGESVAIWSLCTAREARRQGHATRLMNAVLADAADRGGQASLLYAPKEAESFYRSLGYEVLERWQLFMPRRWAAAAANT